MSEPNSFRENINLSLCAGIHGGDRASEARPGRHSRQERRLPVCRKLRVSNMKGKLLYLLLMIPKMSELLNVMGVYGYLRPNLGGNGYIVVDSLSGRPKLRTRQ